MIQATSVPKERVIYEPEYFYPASFIPKTGSLRVLEYTEHLYAEAATARAQEILDVGFSAPKIQPKKNY